MDSYYILDYFPGQVLSNLEIKLIMLTTQESSKYLFKLCNQPGYYLLLEYERFIKSLRLSFQSQMSLNGPAA